MKNLNEVVKMYVAANGIKIKRFADYVGCENPTQCTRWLKGTFKFSDEQMKKAQDFVNGKFMKSVDEILKGENE